MISAFGILLSASVASASQYFYQPAAETSALSVEAGYRNGQYNYGSGEGAATLTGLYRGGLTYQYGLNDAVSLGATLAYSDLERKQGRKFDMTGLEPLEIYLRGRAPLGAFKLVYGLAISIGLERPRLNSSGNVNRSWGDQVDGYNRGLTLTPTVGVVGEVGSSGYGLVLSADAYKADTSLTLYTGSASGDVGGSFGKSNRSSLVGFFEYTEGRALFGIDLGWIKQWETKFSIRGQSDVEPGFGMLGADLYARIALSPSGALVPRLSVRSRFLTDDDPVVEDTRFALAYRVTF